MPDSILVYLVQRELILKHPRKYTSNRESLTSLYATHFGDRAKSFTFDQREGRRNNHVLGFFGKFSAIFLCIVK